jgi:hypothetical protein
MTIYEAFAFLKYLVFAVVIDKCPKKFTRSIQKDKKITLCDYVHEYIILKLYGIFDSHNLNFRPGANITASSLSVCDIINFKNLTFYDKMRETLRITHRGDNLERNQ